mgnify:CR=1 FL=1
MYNDILNISMSTIADARKVIMGSLLSEMIQLFQSTVDLDQ